MEIDTTIEMENNDMLVDTETKNSILELASTVPGIDEAVVGWWLFIEFNIFHPSCTSSQMKLVKHNDAPMSEWHWD